MRIGILTFHRPCNFGANLQAFTSYTYFKSLGHDVKVIDFVKDRDISFYANSVSQMQYDAHQQFIENRLSLTSKVKNGTELYELCLEENFDLIIIGADAVWRTPKEECIYFASWIFENGSVLNKISVSAMSAAHMGDGFYMLDKNTRSLIKKSLEQFSYISVRDSWTRDCLNRDIFDNQEVIKNINYDPVFMLSNYVSDDEWINNGVETKSYILMTLPKNWASCSRRYGLFINLWFKRIKSIAHRNGLVVYELPLPEGKSGLDFDGCVDYPIDPLQWFFWIRNSKGFIGERYHAVVSCISNCVPFYSMDDYGCISTRNIILDYFGLHRKARSMDNKSKIRNLLNDTPFASYRSGRHIESESPRSIMNKILNCDVNKLRAFRDKGQSIFISNMNDLIKQAENEKK